MESQDSHLFSEFGSLNVAILLIVRISTLITIRIFYVAGTCNFMQIYRSREVSQSYLTSVGTTIIALSHALWLVIKIRPQVVLGIRWSSIFYVESIARVRRLSLSGLLLYKLRMVDQLFVQWPQLKSKYPRANYVGRLM
ncbi:hypothetical protein ACJIZ3_006426 [Penstemon smallii]|uniref:UDP-N-acetylglucosamine transferase subunit ALG14 n=1 Tax=Penstemon smallii TaxID=265156 RepID=A0ABD3S7N1_9LAMI